MCDQIKFMTRNDNFRWVGICEHGKIHLSWDHLVLFLDLCELNKLGLILDTAITEDNRFKRHRYALENEEQHWSVPEKGHFDIWIGRYAIRLSPVDYLLFGSMISKAISEIPPKIPVQISPIKMQVEEKIEPGIQIDATPIIQFSNN